MNTDKSTKSAVNFPVKTPEVANFCKKVSQNKGGAVI